MYAANDIAKQDVLNDEKVWGDAIVEIGKAYSSNGDYKALAEKTVDTLYAYDEGTVLFKPTRAAKDQFRLNEHEAVSYFVSGVVPEDYGFAIQPWSKVRFENAGIIIDTDSTTAMKNYYFTDAKTGKEAKAEFTFAYVKNDDGTMFYGEIIIRINDFKGDDFSFSRCMIRMHRTISPWLIVGNNFSNLWGY